MKNIQSLKGIALVALLLLLATLITIEGAFSIEPFGATVINGTPQRAGPDGAESVAAQAGNVTELIITGYSVTQTWQGYFGNVSGTVVLSDSDDNQLYNWTLASPQGEIFASTNSSLTWTNIQCFNYTANSTGDAGVAGGTNQAGINLTTLEAMYNINESDVDGVDETFSLTDHDRFYVSSQEFGEDECISTRVYGSSGPTDQEFEEVLLYEYSTGSVVFTALLEQDLTGFDTATHDFEMLVLEDGHGTDVETTNYYFFVELE